MKLGALLKTDRFETFEEHTARNNAERTRQVRTARLNVARRSDVWTEIPADLVERMGGRCLVSASSDAMYRPYQGLVFESFSASVIAEKNPLFFSVNEDGELTFYERLVGTWTERLERQAEKKLRRAAPRSPRRTAA